MWRITVTTAPYEDEAALRAFAASVDVITYEFENVPTSALGPSGKPETDPPEPPGAGDQPGPDQRKAFLNDLGLQTAPWAAVNSEATCAPPLKRMACPRS
jgi:5-(carboxyamino)imidazole ribonucleotide synthase